jgi:hypothetical protein
MKNLFWSLCVVAGISFLSINNPAFAAEEVKPETKKVCIKTTDAKTKKEVEKCKVVKIHEKHEGTKVPEKAPKK